MEKYRQNVLSHEGKYGISDASFDNAQKVIYSIATYLCEACAFIDVLTWKQGRRQSDLIVSCCRVSSNIDINDWYFFRPVFFLLSNIPRKIINILVHFLFAIVNKPTYCWTIVATKISPYNIKRVLYACNQFEAFESGTSRGLISAHIESLQKVFQFVYTPCLSYYRWLSSTQ